MTSGVRQSSLATTVRCSKPCSVMSSGSGGVVDSADRVTCIAQQQESLDGASNAPRVDYEQPPEVERLETKGTVLQEECLAGSGGVVCVAVQIATHGE